MLSVDLLSASTSIRIGAQNEQLQYMYVPDYSIQPPGIIKYKCNSCLRPLNARPSTVRHPAGPPSATPPVYPSSRRSSAHHPVRQTSDTLQSSARHPARQQLSIRQASAGLQSGTPLNRSSHAHPPAHQPYVTQPTTTLVIRPSPYRQLSVTTRVTRHPTRHTSSDPSNVHHPALPPVRHPSVTQPVLMPHKGHNAVNRMSPSRSNAPPTSPGPSNVHHPASLSPSTRPVKRP